MSDARARVLIVDDEPLNRELLRRVLHSGYQVEEAEDANNAIEILEEGGATISLMLCDHLMPGRTGTQLARVVSERWPHIPILLLTGYDGDEDVVQARTDGLVRAVVSKPWRRAELTDIIAKTLESSET